MNVNTPPKWDGFRFPWEPAEEPRAIRIKFKTADALPCKIIHEALELDPQSPSGLRWKTRPRWHFSREKDWKGANVRCSGNPAGSKRRIRNRVYWQVVISGVNYLVHRIVYFLHYGINPGWLHVDHIDGNSTNNTPQNLRLVTNAQNQRNRNKQLNNTSGHSGVCWDREKEKWKAQIQFNKKSINIGSFVDIENAVAARKAAEIRYFGAYSYDASQNSISAPDNKSQQG